MNLSYKGIEMSEKRILIVEDELLSRIDQNRGEMSRVEFINFLINNQLEGDVGKSNTDNRYVSREEFQEFAQGMKDLLRRFLDFYISYGLELGEEPKDNTFEELKKKLQSLSSGEAKSKTSK
jgi:hypothetical protein